MVCCVANAGCAGFALRPRHGLKSLGTSGKLRYVLNETLLRLQLLQEQERDGDC